MLKYLMPMLLLVVFLMSCGNDDSSVDSFEQGYEMTSSSICDEKISSSIEICHSSSSLKTEKSSSSNNLDKSSISKKEGSSSSSDKREESSSTVKIEDSSSSSVLDKLSSSTNNSSSSDETAESSSSSKNEDSSSSSILDKSSSSTNNSSSSNKIVVSSSSVEVDCSSSSENANISSSSIEESSSSMNSIYDAENNTLTDLRDNQVYKTVTIGEQIWMAENLNYMPEDTAGTIYSGGTVCGGGNEGSQEDSKKCDVFGRLYLSEVVHYNVTNRLQGICPDGWSIPLQTDWQKLINFFESDDIAAAQLKKDSLWKKQNTNESGFSALPSGAYKTAGSKIGYILSNNAYFFFYSFSTEYLYLFDEKSPYSGIIGFSRSDDDSMEAVRCIKN